MIRIFFLIIVSIISFGACGQLRMPAIFGDSMVLQQRTTAPVWGWTAPGTPVEVTGSWSGKSIKGVADKNGHWKVQLPTPGAGGPYYIDIRAGSFIRLNGVLIGEVWIFSGQSNMEMPVAGWANDPIEQSATEIANASYPAIRFFTVQKAVAFSPQEDVTGFWSSCDPHSVRSFSATAYFFARTLYKRLKIPIAVIHTSWGGTVAEAWTSKDALQPMGDFNNQLQTIDSINAHLESIKCKDSILNLSWQQALLKVRVQPVDLTVDEGWKPMELPAFWENGDLPDLDGIVWFKKILKVPDKWAGRDLKLDLGPIDDRDITYFNGRVVDSTMGALAWASDRHYTIPGDLVKGGTNSITICVIDDGGTGGLYGRADQLKIYPADQTGIKGQSLAGSWHYKVGAVKPQPVLNTWPNQPAVLFNGMIAPLIPYAIRGAIWYQGESNVGRARQYTRLFPLMIQDWRERWKTSFPFYFVQIAPFRYGGDGTQAGALRDAQRRTLALSPHTGMAVTLDIGNPGSIHPANKQDVGKRLALWALNQTYHQADIAYSGPLYSNMVIKGNQVRVAFTNTEGGLHCPQLPLEGFELKAADGVWKAATAVISEDEIVLSCPGMAHPVAARYAFYDGSVGRLFNGAGLPAATFTTESLK